MAQKRVEKEKPSKSRIASKSHSKVPLDPTSGSGSFRCSLCHLFTGILDAPYERRMIIPKAPNAGKYRERHWKGQECPPGGPPEGAFVDPENRLTPRYRFAYEFKGRAFSLCTLTLLHCLEDKSPDSIYCGTVLSPAQLFREWFIHERMRTKGLSKQIDLDLLGDVVGSFADDSIHVEKIKRQWFLRKQYDFLGSEYLDKAMSIPVEEGQLDVFELAAILLPDSPPEKLEDCQLQLAIDIRLPIEEQFGEAKPRLLELQRFLYRTCEKPMPRPSRKQEVFGRELYIYLLLGR